MTQLDLGFFQRNDISLEKVQYIVNDALHGLDDGELFCEEKISEHFLFDNGCLRSSNYSEDNGFGLRGIIGDAVSYMHSSEFDLNNLKHAAQAVQNIKGGTQGNFYLPSPKNITHDLYTKANPLAEFSSADKIKILEEIDAYLRKKDNRVRQVSASIYGEYQRVMIICCDGNVKTDERPLVRINISVVVEENNRMESGSSGKGGRNKYSNFILKDDWQKQADEALRQALVNLTSVEVRAGEMPVILGSGWPGVLLHEAVGHGLEGDFNRKKISAFSELVGKRVASKGVTVVDDGTLEKRRGSINIDDEGTESGRNILIEDGILKGYMHDRISARLMNKLPSGNGRRESYKHTPMPRMTNTFMLSGDQSPEDIISSVKDGIYAVNFGGGQVDITSGKFVFSASEAYKVENGEVTVPVKGVTLIGNGPDALTRIKAVGNDLALDKGVGTCGKDGQSVPVGVGMPTILLDKLTVGGTKI